ncbi:MAG: hypothetical protein WC889_09275, partial [Myxococcota bacterium]
MPDIDKDLKVTDLFRKTKAELLELAAALGVDPGEGSLRSQLIRAISMVLRKQARTGSQALEAGRKAAHRVVTQAVRKRRKIARTKGGGSLLDAAVQLAVEKTAMVAEKTA